MNYILPFTDISKELINDERLTLSERFFYIVLVSIAQEHDGEILLDWDNVAKITGRSKKTLRMYMRSLIENGWVSRSDEGGYEVKSEREVNNG
jgi:predicted transcriptional regulator of viral defense system